MYVAGSNGTMNVDGNLTTVTAPGGTVVGYGGNGTLNITNGARVTSYTTVGGTLNSYLGENAGGSGTANITGLYSTWHNDNGLIVANTATSTGNMFVTSGGTANSTIGVIYGTGTVRSTPARRTISRGTGRYSPSTSNPRARRLP